jgi:hypothetical protein
MLLLLQDIQSDAQRQSTANTISPGKSPKAIPQQLNSRCNHKPTVGLPLASTAMVTWSVSSSSSYDKHLVLVVFAFPLTQGSLKQTLSRLCSSFFLLFFFFFFFFPSSHKQRGADIISGWIDGAGNVQVDNRHSPHTNTPLVGTYSLVSCCNWRAVRPCTFGGLRVADTCG